MNKIEEIVANAVSYIGQRENAARNNSGFLDPAFEAEMKEEGWQKSWAWCAIFAKVVFKNVFPERAAELDKLFSPSAVQTFRNFKNAGHAISNVPTAGALVIWQTMDDGKAMATGHVGIVVSVANPLTFETVEGNTSGEGVREGWILAKRDRKVIPDVKNGLKIMGFIHV